MFCPECGKKIPEESIFCKNCGKRVKDTDSKKPANKKSKGDLEKFRD